MTAKVRTRPNVLGGLAGFAWLLVVLVPVYYVVITSLRDQEGFFSSNPLAPPADPTLDSYRLVLENDFLRYLGNSVVVTLATVLITVSVSLLAAYYVVRGGGRLARLTYRSFLLGLAIPLQIGRASCRGRA